MSGDAGSLFTRDPSVITYPDIERPLLTDAGVRHAESVLGVRLPASFVELLRGCNGGYITRDACPTAEATDWVLATPYMLEDWGLPDGLVLIDGARHTQIALDSRDLADGDDEPSVVWIDIERDEELTLADTFAEFVEMLRPASDFDD